MIGKEFIEKTKYPNLEPSLQSQGVPLPDLQVPAPEGAQMIKLPDGKSLKLDAQDFIRLVDRRETLRNYSDKPLSLEELVYLLWGTQGVKSVTDKPVSKRTVPSAGSRHAFETYLLVNRVDGLPPGLYRYMALEHQLARLDVSEKISDILTEACLNQPHVKNSAVTFFWAAVPLRMVWRYCQRGYRYMYLDAGHVCQNLYLLAESIHCGVCAIAAYDDDLVNQALGLDGEDQFAIYIATLGKR
ncbi:MAG TPA: SagB/ThcOx family dehydrogenase [Pelolinea sp.]|nr:SagB/ThcOx family dehydrogenase [Pelolinea sp.]